MIKIANLKLKTQKRLYSLYKEKITEVYDLYFHKIAYQQPSVKEGIIYYEEKYKYRYTLKEISVMLKLEGIASIHFLLAQDQRTHRGVCMFCKDALVYEIRSNTSKQTCDCKGYCDFRGCKKPRPQFYRYCQEHEEEDKKKWPDYEKKIIAERIEREKQRRKEQDQIYIQDFMPGHHYCNEKCSEYVMALKCDNGFVQFEHIHKIFLTDIKSFYDYQMGCIFNTDQDNFYYTWCDSYQLEDAISRKIQEASDEND